MASATVTSHSESDDTRSGNPVDDNLPSTSSGESSQSVGKRKHIITQNPVTSGKIDYDCAARNAQNLLEQIAAITKSIARRRPGSSLNMDLEMDDEAMSTRFPMRLTRNHVVSHNSYSNNNNNKRARMEAGFSGQGMLEGKEMVLQEVEIWWENKLHKFYHPKDTKFSVIRIELANRISLRPDNLLILDDTVEMSDSLPVCDIPKDSELEAFECPDINSEGEVRIKTLRPEFILLRLQGQGGPQTRCSFAMKRLTYLKQLVQDYTKKFGFQGKNFKLVFKGRRVDVEKTPNDYNLEHNDLLWVVEI